MYQSMGKSQLDEDAALYNKMMTRTIPYNGDVGRYYTKSPPPSRSPPPRIPTTPPRIPTTPSRLPTTPRLSKSPPAQRYQHIDGNATEIPESAWFYPHSQEVNLLNDGTPLGIEVRYYLKGG